MTGRGQFPRSTQNVPQGTQLNNMFEIDQLITAGGMGEVYRGHNIQTHDPVAIKIVLPEFAQDDLILELFRKEARILNHLHHEAIVRYYVFSIDATLGLPFLVMEFVDGPSLAERIKTGPFDTASVATLQRHLADGLEKAHQAGVIHRDIAPDNVILPEGRVDRAKIIDFGIARSAAAGGGTLLGGQFAGKYNFVSPEQLGLFDGNVTNRSDIYSLGLVLAACALGKPLDMSGSQVAVIEKRRSVPDLTGIAPPLRGLIEAMLQPDPQDRPQSMAEVADWPTYEPEPEPQDFEKTRIYTTPPSRLPSHPPTRQPSFPPITQLSKPPASQPPHAHEALVQESSRPPSGHSAPPPVEPERELSRPPVPPAPTQRPRQVERRREKKKSRAGLIAAALAVTAVLVAAIGGWAYVEYWSTPYVTAEAEPEVVPDPEPQEPEPQEPETQEPEPQEPEPQEPRFTEADVRDHVNGHDGGDCYFAFPADVGDGRAEIVGYGNQRAPFDALRDSFRARFGFDAAVDVRNVSDDQCVMVDALGSLAAAGAAPVALDLSHSVLRSGGSLSGTISGLGDRHLSLLMVDNFGFVHDLAGYVTRDEGTASFEIDEMSTASEMDFQPQLVLSIASAEPLQSLDLAQSLPASDLVPSLLDEIAGEPDGIATDIGYFKFGS
ncbi:MAG TPA: protein kinase [Aestuariivirgaceae bacterium]|nr:protein kinase [Aestuariivirgaceae bacterium]